MAVWILTQMKRWKHVDSELDYKQVAEQVFLAAECDKLSRELGYPGHTRTYTTHTINRFRPWPGCPCCCTL
jgi:nitrate/nitrite transport system substrate-binding protein